MKKADRECGKVICAAALVALGASVSFGDAVRATSPIVVDGKLDEAAWKDVQWESEMNRIENRAKKGPFSRKTEFAFAYDDHTIYLAVRCYESNLERFRSGQKLTLWQSDNVEVFLSPTGNHFDHYQFSAGPLTDSDYVCFASEGGAIEPDPYAPEWKHAFGVEQDCWTAEYAIPLSAFYMTRNANWSTTWRVNVTRMMNEPVEFASWSKVERVFNEPKNFGTMGGFPMRQVGDDFGVLAVVPECSDGPDGKIAVKITMSVHTEVAGTYRVKLSSMDEERSVELKRGDNTVVVDTLYPKNGRTPTDIVFTRESDGTRFYRSYPVIVDYEPVRLKVTKPAYRANFYPGQDSDVVAGEVTLAKGLTAEVSLEGPGFVRQAAKLDASGTFSFDTKGFEVGTARLVVKTAKGEKKVSVRKLAMTGHRMTWIEDGHLVVNGKPLLKRGIYALGYRTGTKVDERYANEIEPLATPETEPYYNLYPDRLVKGIVARDCIFDKYPSRELLDKIDEKIADSQGKEFFGWYICDEPECSCISPVYLRHVYEYVADKDPYHVIFMASRGGKRFLECADLIETHPYLSPGTRADGSRRYGTPPWKMGAYLDDFQAADRPDKAIGYLPSAFAYRFIAPAEDYPTLDEFRAATWAAMVRGGKTLWPYAGHDIADRASCWEGIRCIFQSFHALEDFILLAKRTTFAKTEQVEGVRYVLPAAEMFAVVNKMGTPAEITLSGFSGDFVEFRGSRRFKGGQTLALKPFEVIVGTTKPYDAGLASIASVRARVLAAEDARQQFDSQLFERDADIDFQSNFVGSHTGSWFKLFDGMPDQQARYSIDKDDCFIELGFKNGFRPKMRTLKLHGYGIIDQTVVSVKQDGVWTKLAPAATEKEKYAFTLFFEDVREIEGLRLDFPGVKGSRNRLEIYEIQMPKVAK